MRAEVPFTFESNPETGVSNSQIGLWLFLAADIMFFGSLFSAYILLRINAPTWPNQEELLNHTLASTSTVLLVVSSILLMVSSSKKIGEKHLFSRIFILLSILCAFVYCATKFYEYRLFQDASLLPSTNSFLGLYYTISGVHLLHLITGIVLVIRSLSCHFSFGSFETLRSYWHYLTILWLCIFATFYYG